MKRSVGLGEAAPRGGKKDGVKPPPGLAADVCPAVIERLDLHQHALAAAVGIVVHLHLLIFRIVSDLVRFDLNDVVALRPTQDAFPHHGLNGVGKQGQDVDVHCDHGLHPLQKIDLQVAQGRVQ